MTARRLQIFAFIAKKLDCFRPNRLILIQFPLNLHQMLFVVQLHLLLRLDYLAINVDAIDLRKCVLLTHILFQIINEGAIKHFVQSMCLAHHLEELLRRQIPGLHVKHALNLVVHFFIFYVYLFWWGHDLYVLGVVKCLDLLIMLQWCLVVLWWLHEFLKFRVVFHFLLFLVVMIVVWVVVEVWLLLAFIYFITITRLIFHWRATVRYYISVVDVFHWVVCLEIIIHHLVYYPLMLWLLHITHLRRKCIIH